MLGVYEDDGWVRSNATLSEGQYVLCSDLCYGTWIFRDLVVRKSILGKEISNSAALNQDSGAGRAVNPVSMREPSRGCFEPGSPGPVGPSIQFQ